METLWTKIETVVERLRIRVPLYVITIISGITFFLFPSFLAVTSFVFLLGFLLVFESIHPNGYKVIFFQPLIPKAFSENLQIGLLILLRTIFIFGGLFFMLMSLSIFISGVFR
ncbi:MULTISPECIES: hypothetical protein [unclassified Bacillus (in: firmicutes)]|uniref:hypothetical protein n=1 Tax=unclassified Bacillus (in: firmicutes) TaxID=185979 RepID=UPI0008E02756|nr:MULTISPECIES: hypothetical protein [unclassified Bacillus (in: firmicutes)]SFB20261.1 hypothetical protein SAMN02799634_10879 [Bacillus sp. UNCCL13]SFQ90844.1 hypothetical protein SAMN04488577_3894 [Bacillus sp. cl95]